MAEQFRKWNQTSLIWSGDHIIKAKGCKRHVAPLDWCHKKSIKLLWPTHHFWILNDVVRVTEWAKSEYKWESPNLHEMPTSAIWLVTLHIFDLFICELEQFSSSSSCVVLTPASVLLLRIKCLLACNIFSYCLQIALGYKVYHLKLFLLFFFSSRCNKKYKIVELIPFHM